MPVYRAFFEERLIDALQRVGEANWVAKHMGADIFFEVHLGSDVVLDELTSLHLTDLCHYENLVLNMKCFARTGGANVGTGDWLLFECDSSVFGEVLETMRTAHRALESLARGSEENPLHTSRGGAQTFFHQVFEGVDKDGSGEIDRNEFQVEL